MESGLDRALGGLTGEQALVLEAAMGGAGAERKRGGAGGAAGLDDLALAGPGGLDRAHAKLGHSPGEEALAEVAAAVSAAAAPLHGQSWARPEGPQQARPSARELPQSLPGVDPIHQLLDRSRPRRRRGPNDDHRGSAGRHRDPAEGGPGRCLGRDHHAERLGPGRP